MGSRAYELQEQKEELDLIDLLERAGILYEPGTDIARQVIQHGHNKISEKQKAIYDAVMSKVKHYRNLSCPVGHHIGSEGLEHYLLGEGCPDCQSNFDSD